MFKFGDFVGAANEHSVLQGVVVKVSGNRVLVCDNPFAATMMKHFGATLEYVKQEFTCKWFNMDECELDDDDDMDDEE